MRIRITGLLVVEKFDGDADRAKISDFAEKFGSAD